jgi:hypothetical protein
MNNPTTYHGSWYVPDARGGDTHKFSGTLTHFGDKPTTLELIHEPHFGSFASYAHYDVIWGEDACGVKFSLFDASLVEDRDFSKTTYYIRFILLGMHLQSLDEPCFDTCWVKYPFLNRWALDSRFDVEFPDVNKTTITLDLSARPSFLAVEIEKGLRLMLWGHITDKLTLFDITVSQATNLNIDTPNNAPLNTYLRTISEFSQFLSIALFAEQHPTEVIFAHKGVKMNYPLLCDSQSSAEPWVLPLIKFNELKGRIPDILKQWHSNYEQLAPICKNLVRSLKKDSAFDTPDFLIVAQALDGYYKRFVNKKDGKDTRQYKHQIDKLLKQFKDVTAVQECNINSEVLTQSRHKYSHLIPDDDEDVKLAVDGADLYWLTQKCIVLLTCCILNMLGLTIQEINLCFKNSPIEQTTLSIPF